MFNFKKITSYRLDELEQKLNQHEKTFDIIKTHFAEVDKAIIALEKNLDDIEKVIDKQNLRIDELTKAKTISKAKKGTSNAKPNASANT